MSFRYCPLCGKKLDSKIEICLYCGHILNKELENESYNSFKKLANSIKSVLGRSLSKKDQNNYLIYLENNADKIKNIIDCFKIPTHYLDESKIKSDFLDVFEKVSEIKKYNKNKELYLELDDKILVYSLSRIFDELKVAVLDANLHFTENQINDSKYKINEFNKIIDIKPPYKNFSTYKQETIKKEYSNLYNLLVEVNSFYLNNKDKLDYLEIKDISYFISNYEKLDAIFNKINKKFDLYKKVEKINSLNLEESIFKIKENSSKKYNGQDLTNTEGLSEEFNQLNEKRNSCNNLYDDSIKILKEYSDLLNYDEKNIFKEFNQIYNNLLTEIDNLEKLLTIPKDIERLNKLKSSKYDHILTNLESNSIKNDFKNSYDNATSLKKYYSLSKKYFSNESKNTKKDSIDNYKLMYLNEIINSYENFDEVIIEINLNYEIDNKIKEIKSINLIISVKDLDKLSNQKRVYEDNYKTALKLLEKHSDKLRADDKLSIESFKKKYELLNEKIVEIKLNNWFKKNKLYLKKFLNIEKEIKYYVSKSKKNEIRQFNKPFYDELFNIKKEFSKYPNLKNKFDHGLINRFISKYEDLDNIVKELNILFWYNDHEEKLVKVNDLFFKPPKQYISYSKKEELLRLNKNLILNVEIINNFLSLRSSSINLNRDVLNNFSKIFKNLDSLTKLTNQKYIELELKNNKSFFDNIDNKSLDNQQRNAVVIDEDNVQIIAGAGSGKTLTLQAKIKYLIKKKGIKPNEILCISYSNASVNDLKRKIKKLNVGDIDIKTFHSLGNSILKDNNETSGVNENALNIVIADYFKNTVFNGDKKSKELLEFLSYYFNVPAEDVNVLGDKFDKEEANSDFRPLLDYIKEKMENCNNETTYKYEKVKSLEELKIANFFFLNDIVYEYEKPYKKDNQKNYKNAFKILEKLIYKNNESKIPKSIYKDFLNNLIKYVANDKKVSVNYRPDFYLPEYDIYLEHFGIDRDCEPPSYFTQDEKVKYKKSIKWKRDFHKKEGNTLIETYSYYNFEDRLIETLKEKLIENGVKFHKINYKKKYLELIEYEKFHLFIKFIKLIKGFISLFKGNGYEFEKFKEFKQINKKEKNIFLRKRNEILLDIIEDIYKTYQKFLDKREDLDFNDMINNASKSIQEMGFSKSYKYIIVDEYQDVSYTRYQLLKTIQDELKCKIIVVGDDWQSIFKFSGCDVSLFSNFSDYFPNPKVMRIESTYRNTQDLIDVSGKFIMKNPNQVKKSLYSKAYPQIHNPIQIYEYGENSQEVYALEQIVKDIISHCPEDVNILILGRNRHDIYPFLYEKKSKEEIEIPKIFKSASNTKIKFLNREFDKDKCVKIKYLKNPKVNITYRTIHSSKGLEEDNVILINLKNKNSGFPNQREDDPILKYVIRNKENFSFAEERRLFYVALTRTKNHTYLLSPKNKKSIFVREIEKDNYNLIVHDFGSKEWSPNKNETRKIPTKLKCPICITGDITLIVTKKSSFFACSHQQCHFETTFFKGSLEDLDDIEYCPLCGSVVYKVRSENGNVYKCSNNDCKFIKDDTSDSSYNFIETSLNCPDCGKKIHLKQNYKTEKSVFKCMDPICNWFGGYYDGELSNLHKVKQCPNCGGILKNKKGKYGSFLGCSNYPNCNYIEKLNRNNFGSNDYSKSSYNDSNHKEDSSKNGNSGNICPQCGKKLVKHNGKYGPFLGCSGFPKCKYVKNLEGNSFNSQNKNLNCEKKNSEKICPKCGSKLVKRFGKFGKFWGCSNYPKCKYTKNIK